jgi:hypothetical protein
MGNKSSTPVPPPCKILTGEELYKLAIIAEENKKAQLDKEANDIVNRLIPLAYKEIKKSAKKGLIKGTIHVDFNINYLVYLEIENVLKSKIKSHFKKAYNISITSLEFGKRCNKYGVNIFTITFELPVPQDIYPPKYSKELKNDFHKYTVTRNVDLKAWIIKDSKFVVSSSKNKVVIGKVSASGDKVVPLSDSDKVECAKNGLEIKAVAESF